MKLTRRLRVIEIINTVRLAIMRCRLKIIPLLRGIIYTPRFSRVALHRRATTRRVCNFLPGLIFSRRSAEFRELSRLVYEDRELLRGVRYRVYEDSSSFFFSSFFLFFSLERGIRA